MDVYKKSVTKISITEYLKSRGMYPNKEGKVTSLFSSPFSSDSDPSFHVYEEQNTFFDFSSGKGGDIIQFVMDYDGLSFRDAIISLCSGSLLPIVSSDVKSVKKDKSLYKNFDVSKYITTDKKDCELIDEYARSRKIVSGYLHGRVPYLDGDKWKYNLAMVFVHRDEDLDVCGVKFRFIDNPAKRFSARGRLLFHIIEGIKDISENTRLFVVESETSANSLARIYEKLDYSYVVLSIGGVGTNVVEIPKAFEDITDRYVIIDYDNNEELYNKRLDRFKHLGVPVKLSLEKGEDINSICVKGGEDLDNLIKEII